ncbi:hypothetical protein D3C85_1393580 [compost metagenome]
MKELKVVPEGVEIVTERDCIPDILAHLMRQDVRIYGVQVVRQSLEDRFLEMTGGEQVG